MPGDKNQQTLNPPGGSKRKKSETVEDETLNEMNLNLQKQMIDLKKRSDLNDKSIKPEDYTKATFEFIVGYIPQIIEACHGTRTLQVKIKELEKENAILKKEIITDQTNQSQLSVIVKNLEPETTERESVHQLKQTFEKVLTDMNCQTECTIADIYRLRNNNNAPKPSLPTFPPVKVTFLSKLQKSAFMMNLKRLDIYKTISVSPDVPRLLLPLYRSQDKVLYELRKKQKNLKGHLRIHGQKVVIMIKNTGQDNFSEYKHSSEDEIDMY